MSLAPGTETIGTALRVGPRPARSTGARRARQRGTRTRTGSTTGSDILPAQRAQLLSHLSHETTSGSAEGNDRGSSASSTRPISWRTRPARSCAPTHEPFLLYYATPVPHSRCRSRIRSRSTAVSGRTCPRGGRYLRHPEPRAAYAAMVTRFDRDIGRLADLLEELGIRDTPSSSSPATTAPPSTSEATIPSSSRGPAACAGRTWLHEGGIRVPLIVDRPGRIEAGSSSDARSRTGPLPDDPGHRKRRGERRGEGRHRPHSGPARNRTCTRSTPCWEFTREADCGPAHRTPGIAPGAHADADAPIELFDLETDPAEEHDVAAANPGCGPDRRDDACLAHAQPRTAVLRSGGTWRGSNPVAGEAACVAVGLVGVMEHPSPTRPTDGRRRDRGQRAP